MSGRCSCSFCRCRMCYVCVPCGASAERQLHGTAPPDCVQRQDVNTNATGVDLLPCAKLKTAAAALATAVTAAATGAAAASDAGEMVDVDCTDDRWFSISIRSSTLIGQKNVL
eukprot:TRINITY_DN322_c2_g1_i1.p1 TRINITY_DN322_c2_g1~~TRINITY_DN322_c2_g1_i1.p1  ORF type:complete len:113 (-),score=15.23 TRINITY_DN322_c2_g1_i1:179-517(-)